MAERDAWEVSLYHFARLLLRDEASARTAVLEVIEAGGATRPPHIDSDRLVMLQFRDLRRRVVKSQTATRLDRRTGELPPSADSVARGLDFAQLSDVLHALPEPGRSAYALLLLDAMEAEWIAKLLDLTPAQFSDAVQSARLAVCEAITAKPEASPQ